MCEFGEAGVIVVGRSARATSQRPTGVMMMMMMMMMMMVMMVEVVVVVVVEVMRLM